MTHKPTIKRVCLCGCGLSFLVFSEASKSFFASRGHAHFAKHRKDDVGALARSFLSTHYKVTRTMVRKYKKAKRSTYVPETEFLEEIACEVIDADSL